ncbi:MAG: membrane protein insertase YidC [Candidatus Babeliales bacterium]
MNIREIIPVLTVAFLITAGFNYFFRDMLVPREAQEIQTGRSFTAPRIENEHKPLNIEIDFYDQKSARKEVLTEVQTDFTRLVFSNNGAVVQGLEFIRRVDDQVEIVPTLELLPREQQCFLVALDEKTPFFYTFEGKKELDDAVELMYTAHTDELSIIKRYVVYKHAPKIDCAITLDPKGGKGVQPRLFITQPMVKAIKKTDLIQGLVNNEGSATTLKKIAKTYDMTRMYWVLPSVFGLEDYYFVHAMIQDSNRFTNRAYFGITDDIVSAILEGPTITAKTSWNLSFYMGPKETRAFELVDSRLDQTLDYGWLTPLCRLFLNILDWLNNYVKSYGWSIILLTILIKLLLMPFTMRSDKKIQDTQKKAPENQRKLQLIRQKYKDNPEMRAQKEAEFARESMAGFGGCVPMVLQMPILITLARIFGNSILLYKVPFLWIPDLSARDPYFILPLLMVGAILFNSAGRATSGQQQVSGIVMALIFGAGTASVSAGLALYFVATMVITALQSRLVARIL